MDKNSIKKYAVWARRELLSRVAQKAEQYGITEKGTADPNADSVNGHLLSTAERRQRQNLIRRIDESGKDGYRQAMEEAAYTWFNRFSALRFMEVNGYLPTHIRVFTDEENAFKPQILTEAIHLEMDGLDMDRVFALKQENKTEELYKYLLITQCNALSEVLPGMFTRIEDYTELLFPDNLLREGSVIEQMISMIPEDDWKDAVQIIGWLYQYYNAEPKDKVFENLKKNIKISKENIPAATQLFTPDWIVRYMVENSLGRLWVEGHPNDALKANWKYYLEEAEQEPDVQAQLAEIRKEYAALKPEDIRVIDPCMGSGHILVYMFDVLIQIYEDYGYSARDAAASILRNNLYGLDIDDRAAQLAYFAVMMKARQYDPRVFRRGIRPHIHAIAESNHIDRAAVTYFENSRADLTDALESVLKELYDAKEYGSILNVTPVDFDSLYARVDEVTDEISLYKTDVLETILPLIQVAEALAQKYHVVVTNPPYMGASGMSAKLSEFVKKYYPDSKSDLFAVFIEKCGEMTVTNGYQAMITQHAWMFLSSFERFRLKVMQKTIVNMVHLGSRAFEEIGGEVVQTTSFVFQNITSQKYKGTYCRLISNNSQDSKERLFFDEQQRYITSNVNFQKISGIPIAYWISKRLLELFSLEKITSQVKACIGMRTGDNERFLRLWYEVSYDKLNLSASNSFDAEKSYAKWFPYNKGGEYRKWYGNQEFVVNWENDGFEIKENTKLVYPQLGDDLGWKISNEARYFKKHICWTDITTKGLSFRDFPIGFIFDASANAAFVNDEHYFNILAFLNSKITDSLAQLLNPTLHFKLGNFNCLPTLILETQEQSELAQKCCSLSKTDWDSFETSWDFKTHPLIKFRTTSRFFRVDDNDCFTDPVSFSIEKSFAAWKLDCDLRFKHLKSNEEELNRIFIDIYGLQDELTPEVEDKDVTVRRADLGRDIRSLISYAVGCMFGRYSLDCEGLAYAGGEWDASKYTTFPADKDNIIPICDDEYFDDDMTGRFVKWVETVFGAESLEQNLRFIADALGGKGSARDVIRSYFLNDFYADHLKIYQKRPIYWLFDSGKKNGFKALIYMHRYQPDTIARMRTDYVHEQQSRYRTAIADLEQRINSASTAERVKLQKQLQKLQAQADEIRVYEEKIHHLADMMVRIDLDDGVKVNYGKFEDVVAKIK